MQVTLQTYLENRARLKKQIVPPREQCTVCRHAKVVCDCADLKPFDAPLEFVLLIHPEEAKRRIATGRLTHSMIRNSQLIEGESFEADPRVQALLDDSARECFILYPAQNALNLSDSNVRTNLMSSARKPLIFVIDGTWRTAKKMMRLSPSLSQLPRMSFEFPGVSRFRIRKQPAAVCLSTLEAVHHVIDLFGINSRPHDHMIEIFDRMVERQIDYQLRLGSSNLNRK